MKRGVIGESSGKIVQKKVFDRDISLLNQGLKELLLFQEVGQGTNNIPVEDFTGLLHALQEC